MELRKSIYQLIDPCTEDGTVVSRAYDWVMLCVIAIGIAPLMFRGQTTWMYVCDYVSCFIFSVDYVLRWITADMRNGNRSEFIRYPFTPMAIIDLLSILPTFVPINASFKLFRMARLFKILRVVRFIRYYKPLRIMVTVIKQESGTLFTVFLFAVFYIFVTALIMFNVDDPVRPATGEVVFEDFFDAFYWATCTLTTVGYGDIYPVSDIGRVISMLSAIVGIAIIALPSGVITAAYLEELKNQKK